MRTFVEVAPCELVTVATFDMHCKTNKEGKKSINFGGLTEIVRNVMGDFFKENGIQKPIPEEVNKYVRLAFENSYPVRIDESLFSIQCSNYHFFTLCYSMPNWEHSEIKEEITSKFSLNKLNYNKESGEFK